MPTWGTASAAAGVISMVLLTAVVVLGILVDRRARLPGLPRFVGLSLHRYASLLTLAFLVLHIVTAVAGPYAHIGLVGAVVPFAAGYSRGWLAAGVVASDLTVALVATSLLRRHLSYRVWRSVHWLAYACWPAALAHSIGTGSGMRSGRLLDLAVACAALAVSAAAWRGAAALRQRGRRPAASSPTGLTRPPLSRPGRSGVTTTALRVDPTACTGFGLCAELLPELIALDRWGYPLLADQAVPASLLRRARRTITDCPALALRLTATPAPAAREDSPLNTRPDRGPFSAPAP
jgi:methionine sulfoxide reductase heme-binding subunit